MANKRQEFCEVKCPKISSPSTKKVVFLVSNKTTIFPSSKWDGKRGHEIFMHDLTNSIKPVVHGASTMHVKRLVMMGHMGIGFEACIPKNFMLV